MWLEVVFSNARIFKQIKIKITMEKKDNIFDLADAYILYGVYLAHRTVGRQLKLGSSKLFFWLRQGSHMCLWSDGY